jgi:hypothetical protein
MPPVPPPVEPSITCSLQPHPLDDVAPVLPAEPALLRAKGNRHVFTETPGQSAHAQLETAASTAIAGLHTPSSSNSDSSSNSPQRVDSSGSGRHVNFAPHGAVYLTVRAVRAQTLKKQFGNGADPCKDAMHDPSDASPACALMKVLLPLPPYSGLLVISKKLM